MASPPFVRRLPNAAVFICDIQEAFRPTIHQFPHVLATTTKLLRASALLSLPVFVTTQNRARLGSTASELQPHLPADLIAVDTDKTRFSMWIPPISTHPFFSTDRGPTDVAIVGIEAHICVAQTALDLLAAGHRVHVLADGVSSGHAGEVGVALARLRAAGASVTTSEAWLYEVLGDAGAPEFKGLVRLVKESAGATRGALTGLVGGAKI
ncbi:Isochorismatase-like protein [Schizothecium vesticola]|uniref:Isochorismatase-like protein n=1 Tax=Schizothecium vesticola TaxID=314040 RepID=A0AA40EH35_9PEZI|nr:Isochorismatase-like protein [Schizothecium vesticola]